MTTTVNGLTAYEVSVAGTVTQYIPQNGLTVDEIAFLDAREAEVPGTHADLQTALENSTWTATGRTGWAHFNGYIVSYDSQEATDLTEIGAVIDIDTADATWTTTDMEAVETKIAALQRLVEKLYS